MCNISMWWYGIAAAISGTIKPFTASCVSLLGLCNNGPKWSLNGWMDGWMEKIGSSKSSSSPAEGDGCPSLLHPGTLVRGYTPFRCVHDLYRNMACCQSCTYLWLPSPQLCAHVPHLFNDFMPSVKKMKVTFPLVNESTRKQQQDFSNSTLSFL